jgi:hypothetical protein
MLKRGLCTTTLSIGSRGAQLAIEVADPTQGSGAIFFY